MTGCLTITKNSIPWPMLVVPFATRNGSNEHFVKTNRLPACCLQNCPGGPFFLGLAPMWNAPMRIGSGRPTNCGSTSTTASRWQPANAFLTSVPHTNATRPPVVNGFSMRRLHIVNAFLMERLLIALRLNALLLHNDGCHRNHLPIALLPLPPRPACPPDVAATTTRGCSRIFAI